MTNRKKSEVVKSILGEQLSSPNLKKFGHAYAPSNIALIKYWGKRNKDLMLPAKSSLSVPLGDLGTTTKVSVADHDQITLNGDRIDPQGKFAKRVWNFIDLIRPAGMAFSIETTNTIPTGAGVASSASGGAGLVLACDDLFGWNLEKRELSILSRLISGSASRSVYPNSFAHWRRGDRDDGMDSYAAGIDGGDWTQLRVGLLVISDKKKKVSSRSGMQDASSSPHYDDWLEQSANDLDQIQSAIAVGDFNTLGSIAERDALSMHRVMQTQKPPLNYFLPETERIIESVKDFRENGVEVYCTIDAGPNVKLLYQQKDEPAIRDRFDGIVSIRPFN